MQLRLRHAEGDMLRKSLFHVERKGSLHRHQVPYSLSNQSLSEGTLRQIRLNPTVSNWIEAR
jgi:hypothetical protein